MLSPTVQLGQILQIVTVISVVGGAVFKAGQWVSDIRADLRTETLARIEHDAALSDALASQLAGETSARKETVQSLLESQATLLTTLGRIDRSFQHAFSTLQPQPRRQP